MTITKDEIKEGIGMDADPDGADKTDAERAYNSLHYYLISLLANSENNTNEQFDIDDVDRVLELAQEYANAYCQEKLHKSLLKTTGLDSKKE